MNCLFGRKTFTFSLAAVLILLLAAPGGAFTEETDSARYVSSLLSRLPDPFPSPDRFHYDGKLSAGKVLVASRNIADPRFKETVILMVKYDSDGAMGLIINRPTEMRLHTVVPEIKGLQKRTDAVFIGGPVAKNQLFMLIRSATPPERSLKILKEVYVSSDMAVLRRMVEESKKGERFRVYSGYSGWAAGQLEREVSRSDWHVMEADADTIFEKDPSVIWPEFIRRSSMIQVRLQSDKNSSTESNKAPESYRAVSLHCSIPFADR